MVKSLAINEVRTLLKPIWGISTLKSLSVPATLDALDQINLFISEAVQSANLDNTADYNLQLAAGELATNIIIHGYQENGIEGNLELTATTNGNSLTITIEDTAVPFDPLEATAPDLDLPLEERPIGGLGIFLVRESVDDFRYERVGNRNRNSLVANRKTGTV